MCGICGFNLERAVDYNPKSVLQCMTRSLEHRGPDDEGFYEEMPLFLGHRRLKIIDLSTGDQPMTNEDGSVVVVFNGEIYNYRELQAKLEEKGHTFRTRSDTEVLVHLWEELGTDLPNALNGMFALAVWDKKQKSLFLARDRMGQKPLYYSATPKAFVFASELKSLMLHPAVSKELDPQSVSRYLMFDSVAAPNTILRGSNKLEPGTWLLYRDGEIRTGHYWDITFPGKDKKFPDMRELSSQFYSLLKDSVERRMISDVPLGVFLSGGIDSSSITGLMCKLAGPRNVKTFSVGFTNDSFDESLHAKQVANHFGTQHQSEILEAHTMMELLPGIIARLDEPMADNSLIPTYFLSRFTRQHVTVALGGDGGDELCLGYPTFRAHKVARWYEKLPGFLRAFIRSIVHSLPVNTRNISLDYQAKQFVTGMEYNRFDRHFVWIGSIPPHEQGGVLQPDFAPDGASAVFDQVARLVAQCTPRDDFDLLTYLYSKLYMGADILTKVDRASMMHSLEVRAPLLDPQVVDFLTALPTRYKMTGFTMKQILKHSFKETLPTEILKRKKKGFGIPMAEWLKSEMRPWVEELLSPDSLNRFGVFQPASVQSMWDQHLNGVRDCRKPLWSIIVLMLWMQENLKDNQFVIG